MPGPTVDNRVNGLQTLSNGQFNSPETLFAQLELTGFWGQGTNSNMIIERAFALPKLPTNLIVGGRLAPGLAILNRNAVPSSVNTDSRFALGLMQLQPHQVYKQRVSNTLPITATPEPIVEPQVLASLRGYARQIQVPQALVNLVAPLIDENNLQLSPAPQGLQNWQAKRFSLSAVFHESFQEGAQQTKFQMLAVVALDRLTVQRLRDSFLAWVAGVANIGPNLSNDPRLCAWFVETPVTDRPFISRTIMNSIGQVRGYQLIGLLRILKGNDIANRVLTLEKYSREQLVKVPIYDTPLRQEIGRYVETQIDLVNINTLPNNKSNLAETPWTAKNALKNIPQELITLKYVIDNPTTNYTWFKPGGTLLFLGNKVGNFAKYVGDVLGANVAKERSTDAESWMRGTLPPAKNISAPPQGLQQLRQDSSFDINPWKAGWELGERFPRGRLLSDEEYNFVEAMSGNNPNIQLNPSQQAYANMWLSCAGLFPIDSAVQFLKARKFYTWLELEASYRILLATLAWQRYAENNLTLAEVKDTPAWRLGRSMEIGYLLRENGDKNRINKLINELDEDIRAEWLKTFLNQQNTMVGLHADAGQAPLNPITKQIVEAGALKESALLFRKIIKDDFTEQDLQNPKDAIMKGADGTENSNFALKHQETVSQIMSRVLLLLHAGLKLYNKTTRAFEPYDGGAVVRALSHGGRVNIRIPQVSPTDTVKPYDLSDWLGLSAQGHLIYLGPAFSRPFGTHHHEIGKNSSGAGSGSFREVGSSKAALANKFNTRTWGINIAAGGIGRRDFNNDVIVSDGAHGHVFISFREPQADQDGGMMIGVETTAAGAPSTVGYHHGPESTEATANPESSFGGLKKDKIGNGVTPKAKLRGNATSITKKTEETTYDIKKYERKTKIVDKDKRQVSDEETLGRFIDLKQLNGGNWLTLLLRYEEAFNNVIAKDGLVAAYVDLVNLGVKIKAEAEKLLQATPALRSDRGELIAKHQTYLEGASSDNGGGHIPLRVAGANTAVPNATTTLTAYRYQLALPTNNQPIVTTQDTVLSYRQIPFNETVGNNSFVPLANTHPKATEIRANPANFVRRALVYRAVTARWHHPLVSQADTNISLLSGSGVSFGISCSLSLLKANLTNATGANSYLTRIANQLRVEQDVLVKFLTDSNLNAIQPNSDLFNNVDVVLLESSFAFADEQQFLMSRAQMVEQNQLYELEDMFAKGSLVDFITSLRQPQNQRTSLDGLRLRYRLADKINAPDMNTKLGYVLTQPPDNPAQPEKPTAVLDLFTKYALDFRHDNQTAPPAGRPRSAAPGAAPSGRQRADVTNQRGLGWAPINAEGTTPQLTPTRPARTLNPNQAGRGNVISGAAAGSVQQINESETIVPPVVLFNL